VVSERFGFLSPPKKIATLRGVIAMPPTLPGWNTCLSVSLKWQLLQKGVLKNRESSGVRRGAEGG